MNDAILLNLLLSVFVPLRPSPPRPDPPLPLHHPDPAFLPAWTIFNAPSQITWGMIVDRMVRYIKAHNFDEDQST